MQSEVKELNPHHLLNSSDEYNRLVSSSPQGSIYCRQWWLDSVAPGRYQIIELRRGGELVAAWPIVFDSEQGVTVLKMPRLTQKLGILFSPVKCKPAEQLSREHELTLELIARLPKKVGFVHNFHESITNWLPFYWSGFKQTTRYTYVIPDLRDVKKVWGDMRPLCRKNIRKAVASELRITQDLTLDEFITLQEAVFKRQGRECPLPRALIERVDDACRQRNCRKIIAAIDAGNRVHAAAYIVWDQDTAYYIMGGSDPTLRGSGAMRLVQWEAIQFAATFALRFDFEGSMVREIEAAFRSFGAQQIPFSCISRKSSGSTQSKFHPRRVASAILRRVADKLDN